MNFLLNILILSQLAFAEYESPLEESFPPFIDDHIESTLPARSDIELMFELNTPARRQGSRGTCTMFSTLGTLEHLLIKKGLANRETVDLSEEWMEYIIMKDKQDEGSSTSRNLNAVKKYGYIDELTWPYLGKKWLKVSDYTIANETCGHLIQDPVGLKSCLLGHRDPYLLDYSDAKLSQRDPDFITIRNTAYANRDGVIQTLYKKRKSHRLKYTSSIKRLLNANQNVIMGFKLYYGAWNSSKTTKYDIQERDKQKFYRGEVTYPEAGSRDRRISGKRGGGHSIIIIGYDDERIVKSRMLMEDGRWKEFTYQGVYYFKNSWGVKGFGKNFQFNGHSFPGYGMITQKYAHEFGTFFQVN